MSVSAEIFRADYDGTGLVDTFAFTWRIYTQSDIRIYEYVAATDTETEKSIPADYTVTGVGDTAGTVTRVAGVLPTGTHLTIVRAQPLLQSAGFLNQSGFFPVNHEKAHDKVVMALQTHGELLDRVPFLPATLVGFNNAMPRPVADTVIGYNSLGTGFVNLATTAVSIGVPTDGTVTLLKMPDGVFTDSAAARLKFADKFVTYAKIQDVSAQYRLLGRSSAGAGVIEEIVTSAFMLTLLDDTTAAAARTTLGLGTAATATTGTGSGQVPLIGTASATASLAGLVELGTSAEVKAATDAARVAALNVLRHHPGVAKAWVAFNGTDTPPITPLASYGISGTIDSPTTAAYTITLANAMTDTNYGIAGSIRRTNTNVDGYVDERDSASFTKTTTQFQAVTVKQDGSAAEFSFVFIVVYGNEV